MVGSEHLQFSSMEQLVMSGSATKRLLLSCMLGGAIGLEREWRHKDSGLRTNMLICMGAALFTIMSIVLAGDSTPNKGQVAANIVQGVGFLGAGLILHTKNRVLGLTTAATAFVVAAIGMTCGAGLYLVAFFAALLLLLALQVVGTGETKLGWKRYPMIYEVRANVGAMLPSDVVGQSRAEDVAQNVTAAQQRMQHAILRALDGSGKRFTVIDRDNVGGLERVSFQVMATRQNHERLLSELRASDATDQVVAFADQEDE
jgi:putative Mg2+ transporter-C (MgtC) family protein